MASQRTSWTQNADATLVVIAVLWAVFLVDWLLPVNLCALGIRPRELGGLLGIVLCPFLHANLKHLIANSVALFVLLSLSLTVGRLLTICALLYVLLISGGTVWLLGRAGTVHVGASGLIFGLIGFLAASGILRLEWRALAYAILALFLYGGSLFTLFENQPGVSWLSHVGGFIGGILSAWWLRKMPAR